MALACPCLALGAHVNKNPWFGFKNQIFEAQQNPTLKACDMQ